MRTGWLARGCSCLAVAAALGGCSAATNSATSVSGTTLTVYASVPTQATACPRSQSPACDVLNGEKLALSQARGAVGKFKVVLKSLPGDTIAQITDNARTAISDKTTIAYLADLLPGTSDQSVPITNQLGILQVSPTDNALELTEGSPVLPDTRKALFYPSQGTYGYTFARVVPSASIEASALVEEMLTDHVSKLYVSDDGATCTTADTTGCYGDAIANAVSSDAHAKSISVQNTAAGADAAFIGSNASASAAKMFNGLASQDPNMKLFGSSSLATAAFAAGLTRAASAHMVISSPGFVRLPATAASFAAAYRTAYGNTPGALATFGYMAMSAVLDALRHAGSTANNRADVVNDFFTLRNQQSPFGSFTIDPKSGNISLPAPTIVFNRIRGGQFAPFKSAPATA